MLKGIDLSSVAIKEGRCRDPELNIAIGNGESINFHPNEFDIVVCLGSLEHYLNIDKGLSEMYRVLKYNGILVVLLPTDFIWLELDVQPVETVSTIEEWKARIESIKFRILEIFDTTKDEELAKFSNKCHIFIAKKN